MISALFVEKVEKRRQKLRELRIGLAEAQPTIAKFRQTIAG